MSGLREDLVLDDEPKHELEWQVPTILIVDDHTIVRKGMRAMLEADGNVQVVGEACNGREAIALVGELRPQVVLMDVQMPQLDGIETTRQILANWPDTAVIIMTNYEDEALLTEALSAGASGFLLKGTSRHQLNLAIDAVCNGGGVIEPSLLRRAFANAKQTPPLPKKESEPDTVGLTERELTVLSRIALGQSNRDIANELGLSLVTIKRDVQNIFVKLNAADRTHAAIIAARRGLLDETTSGHTQ
jgi:DNA-binding NarL/FixJ family response regulator